VINFSKKAILNIGALTLLSISSSNLYAGYYNEKDSGVFVSGSIGASQSSSYKSGSAYFDGFVPVYSYEYDFQSQNSIAGSVSVGYKISFGEKDKWNQFYTGGSFNYYNLGRVIDPVKSEVTFKDDKATLDSTAYTTLNALGIELMIGKYLASPFSVELGLGVGGNTASTSQGVMGTFKLRAGYNT
jgi:hypothetical protein